MKKEREMASSKSMVRLAADAAMPPSEADRKKLELGDMMEHAHGKMREHIEEEVEKVDRRSKRLHS